MEKSKISGVPLTLGHLILLLIVSITFFSIVSDIIDISLHSVDDWFDIEDSRFALATFIVMFPVFLGLVKYVEHRGGASHNVCNVATFISAAVILCSAIYTLFQFINGDLTDKFLLKLAVIFVMSILVFIYYVRIPALQQLSSLVQWARYGTIVLGVGAIIWSGATIDVLHAKDVNSDIDRLQSVNSTAHSIQNANSDNRAEDEISASVPSSIEYTQQGETFTLCTELKRKVSFRINHWNTLYGVIDRTLTGNKACFTFNAKRKTWGS